MGQWDDVALVIPLIILYSRLPAYRHNQPSQPNQQPTQPLNFFFF
jgi:hypothetical protein